MLRGAPDEVGERAQRPGPLRHVQAYVRDGIQRYYPRPGQPVPPGPLRQSDQRGKVGHHRRLQPVRAGGQRGPLVLPVPGDQLVREPHYPQLAGMLPEPRGRVVLVQRPLHEAHPGIVPLPGPPALFQHPRDLLGLRLGGGLSGLQPRGARGQPGRRGAAAHLRRREARGQGGELGAPARVGVPRGPVLGRARRGRLGGSARLRGGQALGAEPAGYGGRPVVQRGPLPERLGLPLQHAGPARVDLREAGGRRLPGRLLFSQQDAARGRLRAGAAARLLGPGRLAARARQPGAYLGEPPRGGGQPRVRLLVRPHLFGDLPLQAGLGGAVLLGLGRDGPLFGLQPAHLRPARVPLFRQPRRAFPGLRGLPFRAGPLLPHRPQAGRRRYGPEAGRLARQRCVAHRRVAVLLEGVYVLLHLAHARECHLEPPVGLLQHLLGLCLLLVKVRQAYQVLYGPALLLGGELGYARDRPLLDGVQLVQAGVGDLHHVEHLGVAGLLPVDVVGVLALRAQLARDLHLVRVGRYAPVRVVQVHAHAGHRRPPAAAVRVVYEGAQPVHPHHGGPVLAHREQDGIQYVALPGAVGARYGDEPRHEVDDRVPEPERLEAEQFDPPYVHHAPPARRGVITFADRRSRGFSAAARGARGAGGGGRGAPGSRPRRGGGARSGGAAARGRAAARRCAVGRRRRGSGGAAQAARLRRRGSGGAAQAARLRRRGSGGAAQAARLRRRGSGGAAQAARLRREERGRRRRRSPAPSPRRPAWPRGRASAAWGAS